MDPRTTFEAFVAAAAAGDEDTARGLSTAAGWAEGGDSAARFVRQALQARVEVRQADPERIHGHRAVVPAVATAAEAGGETLWFLLQDTAEGWRVEGTARNPAVASLYLRGRIARPPAFASLPASDAAEAWARGWIAGRPVEAVGSGGKAALEVLEELRADAAAVEVVRTVEVPGSGRLGVALSFSQADGSTQTVWAVLEAAERTGLLRLVGRSWVGSVDALFQGLSPVWPEAGAEASGRRYTDAEARAILEQAVAEVLAERSGDGFGERVAAALVDLFTEALEEAGDAPESPEAGEEAETSRSATRFQQRLGEAVAGLFTGAGAGDLDAEDLRIDSAFVREKGPEIVTSLVTAFASALVPPDLTLDLPASDDDGSRVAVKLDLADLIQGLFTPAADPPPQEGGDG